MKDKRILLLFFILVLLNSLDVLTTLKGLELGAAEANPMSQRLMSSFGLAETMLLKFFLILFFGCMGLATCWYALHRDPEYFRHTRAVLTVVFAAVIGAYLYVVASNLITIWLQLNFYA